MRSIDLRYFETLAPGDIVIVTDEFARDPLTGARGISSRAAFITRLSYNLGGPSPDGSVRDMIGEVELFFLDVQRGSEYVPCADIDWEWNLGGHSAGYLHASSQIVCKPHQYTRLMDIDTRRGPVTDVEPLDAEHFVAGDKITIVERDPADPAAPVTWDRTVSSVSANAIILTTALSSPAWDATKKYRVMYQAYASCTATQIDKSFQADDTDEMIQDADIPHHFSVDEEQADYRRASVTDRPELIPTLAWGDGKGMDVGIDRQLAINANAYIDYKSAHQCVTLTVGTAGLLSPGAVDWQILQMTPIFLGTEHLSAAVTRSLTVAAQWRAGTAVNSYLRITLSRSLPGVGPSQGFASAWANPVHAGEFSQVTYGPITSTTYQITADTVLSLGVKGLHNGLAWLILEGSGDAETKGIVKCLEGPRIA